MTNVTISIDEEDLKQARIAALQQGTSLNAVLRNYIKSYIGGAQQFERVTTRLLKRAEKSQYGSKGKVFNRNELYER